MKTVRAVSKACVLAAGLCLLAATPVLPQTSGANTSGQSEAAEVKPAPASNKKKPKLLEITRVSTDEAARGVAKEKATRDEEVSNAEPSEPAAPAVTELKAIDRGSETPRSAVTNSDSKGSKASKVHGRVYGSVDPKNSSDRRQGAAIGAGSKSGKTSIYVETEGSRGTTPPNR